MPVVTIRSLPIQADIGSILPELNQALAKVFSCADEHVWSCWQWLQPGHYAVGSELAAQQPVASHSPLVEILAFEGRPQAVKSAAMQCAADILTRHLQLAAGNVFVLYREAQSGQVFDGGQVIIRRA